MSNEISVQKSESSNMTSRNVESPQMSGKKRSLKRIAETECGALSRNKSCSSKSFKIVNLLLPSYYKGNEIQQQCSDNTSQVCWFCIPKENEYFENKVIEVVDCFDPEKKKLQQLLCRPADGFNQNCFQLKVKSKSRVVDSVGGGRHDMLETVPYCCRQRYNKRTRIKVNRKKEHETRCKDLDAQRHLKVRFQSCKHLHAPSETECNNSNSTDIRPSGCQSKNDKTLRGRVIRVQGDGRCLFRSLVTCLSPDLQKTNRDDFGCPLRRPDELFETHMADVFRMHVVKLMHDNAHFYGQLEPTILNADGPIPTWYSHFRERLDDMMLTSTMPGDLELNAISMALERQVLVLDSNLRPIVIYGKERYPQCEVVVVRFTRLGTDVGHYDAVILEDDSFDVLDFSNNSCFKKNEPSDEMETDALVRFTNLVSKHKDSSDDDYPMDSFGHKCVQVPSLKDLICDESEDKNFSSNKPIFDIEDRVNESLDDSRNKLSDNIDSDAGVLSNNETANVEPLTKPTHDTIVLDDTDLFVVLGNDSRGNKWSSKKNETRVKSRSGTRSRITSKIASTLKESNSNTRCRGVVSRRGKSLSHKKMGSKKGRDMRKGETKPTMPGTKSKHSQRTPRVRKRKTNSSIKEEPVSKKRKISNGPNGETPSPQNKNDRISQSSKKRRVSEKPGSEGGGDIDPIRDPIRVPPIQDPIFNNPHDGRICLMCQQPSVLRESIVMCTLCGRVAHKECVACRQGDAAVAGDYFLCWICIQN